MYKSIIRISLSGKQLMKGKQMKRSGCIVLYFRILILFLIKKFAYISIGVSNKFGVRAFPGSFIGAWKPITRPKLKTVRGAIGFALC